MTCGVYEIVNKKTNQSYIGRSINIENRWNGHKTAPTNNMLPTIELYESNPEMVEFNIIRKIDETAFDKEELKFITSVCELYEINQRGGWNSDKLINGRDGSILRCPPSILSKRELLPACIDVEDILYGIEQWTNEVYKFRKDFRVDSIKRKEDRFDKDNVLYWSNQYFKLKEEYDELKKRELPPSFMEQQKAESLQYRAKMETDYEYFKLKKENDLLSDENEELKTKVSFWKEKCISWREKFHNLSESLTSKRKQSKKEENLSSSSNLDFDDIFTFDDLIR